MNDIVVGDIIEVADKVILFPESMWYSSSDNEKTIVDIPQLQINDKCIVLAIMDSDQNDPDDSIFSALVVSPIGIGCLILDATLISKL